MPRNPRLHGDGATYHVILRGNHRQPIFHRDDDRARFNRLIADSLDKYRCRIHAFCWMTNHIHAVIQVTDIPLGRFMQRVASQYARYFQQTMTTTGHLFERRYHPILVDVDAYLLALIRYIHLNPVRAGIVQDPAQYPWSSHRAYLGADAIAWLTMDLVRPMLGSTPIAARNSYLRLMEADASTEDNSPFWRGSDWDERALGDREFIETLTLPRRESRSKRSLEDVIAEACREFGTTPAQIKSPSRSRDVSRVRAAIAHTAIDERIASLAHIARVLNRDPSSLLKVIGHYYAPARTRLPK